jgi:hypothetical protein
MKKTTQEQKECLDSDHLNHKDCPTKRQWGLEAARAANKAQAKLVENYNAQCRRCNLGEPKEFHGCEPYPQPTDGLITGWEEKMANVYCKVVGKDKRYDMNVFLDGIASLLKEQKQKTREDTIDECLTVLRSFKDKHFCLDCNKKEFLPSLKALKPKPHA